MVYKTKNKFLSILLHPKSIGWHNLFHIWPDHSNLGYPRRVSLLNARYVCAQETRGFFITKSCVFFTLIAILMEWHSMG